VQANLNAHIAHVEHMVHYWANLSAQPAQLGNMVTQKVPTIQTLANNARMMESTVLKQVQFSARNAQLDRSRGSVASLVSFPTGFSS